jgi:hypothetical protein
MMPTLPGAQMAICGLCIPAGGTHVCPFGRVELMISHDVA